jgi:hypothetical protein
MKKNIKYLKFLLDFQEMLTYGIHRDYPVTNSKKITVGFNGLLLTEPGPVELLYNPLWATS